LFRANDLFSTHVLTEIKATVALNGVQQLGAHDCLRVIGWQFEQIHARVRTRQVTLVVRAQLDAELGLQRAESEQRRAWTRRRVFEQRGLLFLHEISVNIRVLTRVTCRTGVNSESTSQNMSITG